MKNMFKGMEISQITVVTNQGVGISTIGENGIVRFEDRSLEYEDNIHSEYWAINSDNKVIKVFQNCPVDITYRKKEGE